MEKRYATTLNLGKIAYGNNVRKANPVYVDIVLTEQSSFPKYGLSISGEILTSKEKSFWCMGQCLDTIEKYIDTPEFIRVLEWWHLYHLNFLHGKKIPNYTVKEIKDFIIEHSKEVELC